MVAQPFQVLDQRRAALLSRRPVNASEADTGGVSDDLGNHSPSYIAQPVGFSDADVLEVQVVAGHPVMDHPDHVDQVVIARGEAKMGFVVLRMKQANVLERIIFKS